MVIHERYQALALKAANLAGSTPRILKSDCWNEGRNLDGYYYPVATRLPGDVVCLELDSGRIEQARRDCPHLRVVRGRIEALPFADGTFDTVLDLSTIDHVADHRTVLDEYARVLRPAGILLVVAWFSHRAGALAKGHPDPWGEVQYYFPLAAFTRSLARDFDIVESAGFPEFANTEFLHRFLCRKSAARRV
jgi:ubiquinone/menaquinone biosynthesis C-methylase UbiE